MYPSLRQPALFDFVGLERFSKNAESCAIPPAPPAQRANFAGRHFLPVRPAGFAVHAQFLRGATSGSTRGEYRRLRNA